MMLRWFHYSGRSEVEPLLLRAVALWWQSCVMPWCCVWHAIHCGRWMECELWWLQVVSGGSWRSNKRTSRWSCAIWCSKLIRLREMKWGEEKMMLVAARVPKRGGGREWDKRVLGWENKKGIGLRRFLVGKNFMDRCRWLHITLG